ncbi:MAG: hypothetical protein M3Y59_11740 [Myxococcota bacterium]|nr:hypothetical protein [Myxococcota bacterium]
MNIAAQIIIGLAGRSMRSQAASAADSRVTDRGRRRGWVGATSMPSRWGRGGHRALRLAGKGPGALRDLPGAIAFHLHLLGDLVAPAGPDGSIWAVPYFQPFSAHELEVG